MRWWHGGILGLVLLAWAEEVHAQGRWSRRWRRERAMTWVAPPAPTVSVVSPVQHSEVRHSEEKVEDAMGEVNQKRAQKGLPPLQVDSSLCAAAYRCARQRASRLIAGHLPESDFSYLEGAQAAVAGAGALDDSWGWETCAYDDLRYTVGGAAWVRGPDGKRYMHFFGR